MPNPILWVDPLGLSCKETALSLAAAAAISMSPVAPVDPITTYRNNSASTTEVDIFTNAENYWERAEDNAVKEGSFFKFLGSRIMGGFASLGRTAANFGPNAYNSIVNNTKTVANVTTLMIDDNFGTNMEGYRNTEPYNIKPLFLESDEEFESRMQGILEKGNAGKGHALTYRESMWLWENGNGKTIIVDGRVLDTVNIAGHSIVLPLPLDDLKVHGHAGTNPANGRIYDGQYDFDVQPNENNDPITGIRNLLNEEAIREHGDGTPYEIEYRYEDSFFE